METILKSDLEKSVKLGEVEVFTAEQIKQFATDAYEEIQKSVDGQDKMYAEVASEVKSFKPIKVWDDKTLEKSIMFIRPAQIRWDEPVGDDICKSRSGTYLNTPENRKLGRVGKKYGVEVTEKPEEADNYRAPGAVYTNKQLNRMAAEQEVTESGINDLKTVLSKRFKDPESQEYHDKVQELVKRYLKKYTPKSKHKMIDEQSWMEDEMFGGGEHKNVKETINYLNELIQDITSEKD